MKNEKLLEVGKKVVLEMVGRYKIKVYHAEAEGPHGEGEVEPLKCHHCGRNLKKGWGVTVDGQWHLVGKDCYQKFCREEMLHYDAINQAAREAKEKEGK